MSVGAGAAAGWTGLRHGRARAHTTGPPRAKFVARAWAAGRAETAAQAERWFLWAPAAAGAGAALYVVLPREPLLWTGLALAGVALALAIAAQRWGRSQALATAAALLAFGGAGFAVGVVKTRLVAAPLAPASRHPVRVEGWVVDVVSADASRERVLVAPVRLGRLSPEETPALVRISLRGGALAAPGSAIRVPAIMGPPPPPAAPGAYDFARDAWFSGIGGSGLALRAPEPARLPPPPLALRAELALNAARWSLAERLVARLGPRRGGLAAALVTGHQAWLDPDDVQAMRDSGLAHILSISGVHMAIVGGFVFAGVRLLAAAWPWLALRVSGKKLAAATGLVAVCGYLVLAGAPAPAVRSAVTAGIAFVAILLDRRALTLHSLALAALLILAVQPEAIAQPGFEMSFAATAALLALAEVWPHAPRPVGPWPVRLLQHVKDGLVAGAAVSLVAGLSTDPFAIQHFNRITLWGLPANLATELLSSFVIMPALALGAVLETVGLGGAPLSVAGWGLDALTVVARVFAHAPHAVALWPSAPAAALPVSALGLLVMCLWRGRGRWLGAPLFVAVWLWPRTPPPDLWVAPDGANLAVATAGPHRQAILMRPRSQRLAFELWAKRRGYGFDPVGEEAQASADMRFSCKRSACTPVDGGATPVAAWFGLRAPDAAQVDALCAAAQVVVLRTGALPPLAEAPHCRGRVVLDEQDLARGGSPELWRTQGGWRVLWGEAVRGDRPWTAGGGLSDSGG